MKTFPLPSALVFLTLMFFAVGCGKNGAVDAPEEVAWHSLSKVDETLAHAAPSDASDIAIMVSELSPPAKIPNAEMVLTMLVDLKTLGQELRETSESDVPDHLEAMHVLVGKMLTEAGLDAHVCEHDHHGHDGHGEDAADTRGSEESGPEE